MASDMHANACQGADEARRKRAQSPSRTLVYCSLKSATLSSAAPCTDSATPPSSSLAPLSHQGGVRSITRGFAVSPGLAAALCAACWRAQTWPGFGSSGTRARTRGAPVWISSCQEVPAQICENDRYPGCTGRCPRARCQVRFEGEIDSALHDVGQSESEGPVSCLTAPSALLSPIPAGVPWPRRASRPSGAFRALTGELARARMGLDAIPGGPAYRRGCSSDDSGVWIAADARPDWNARCPAPAAPRPRLPLPAAPPSPAGAR